jgi:peptidoglycan/xylan/chitin deacetylase (PgdA/CDA1 family)
MPAIVRRRLSWPIAAVLAAAGIGVVAVLWRGHVHDGPGAVHPTGHRSAPHSNKSRTSDIYLPIEEKSAPEKIIPFERGLVTVTFDDGLQSQYVVGLPLLQQYTIPATFYLIPDLLGTPNYMSVRQVRHLIKKGNEIASHTLTHPYLTRVSPIQLRRELQTSRRKLERFSPGITNFASPFGDYDDHVLKTVKKYYASHRTVDDGFNSKNDFDIYRIKVQNIQSNTTTAEVRDWVSEARRDRTWLVFVYHDITRHGDNFSVTPQDLERHLIEIKESGIRTATISRALAEVVPQVSPTATKPRRGQEGLSH